MKKKAVFIAPPASIDWVYGLGRIDRVAAVTDLYDPIIPPDDFAAHTDALAQAQVIFSTWGLANFDTKQLENMPNLEAVFYAAGSVQGFARPYLERDIVIMSAWMANAVAVAEYTFAQVILANKCYLQNVRDCATFKGRAAGPASGKGNFEQTVAVLGAGAIGTKVIRLLQSLSLRVIVFDPFLPDQRAADLGVEKVSLEQAFEQADVVTNHIANNEQTQGLISRDVIGRLKSTATFINTGRGATVDEAALIDKLRAEPTITALLDVTWPEPPAQDSPFYDLPNVHLTSHIAGALGNEVVRMADYCLEEFAAWETGQPMQYRVTLEMLKTMA